MFERFTSGARQTVVLAQETARQTDAHSITTAHLLIGVASTDDVAAEALSARGADRGALLAAATDDLDADALASLGIDLEAVRKQADATFGEGALRRAGRREGRAPAHLPFDRAAKKTLEVALREAVRLGHRRIEAGHVLLALIRLDDTEGHALLRRCGVDTDALARDVTELLGRAAA